MPGQARHQRETAVLLAGYFGNSDRFWLGLQMDYELAEAHRRLAA